MKIMRFNNVDGSPCWYTIIGQTASDWVLRQVSLYKYSHRVIPPLFSPHAAAL
jgi:hypothetical protein